MSDKPNFEVFTTPVGELVYPWVSKADVRYEPDGVYQTKLLLPFEGAQELIATLEGVLKGFIGTLDVAKQASYNAAPVYEDELDEDAELPPRLTMTMLVTQPNSEGILNTA